jgi:branched-chain amino acid transport system substrate-binding protein
VKKQVIAGLLALLLVVALGVFAAACGGTTTTTTAVTTPTTAATTPTTGGTGTTVAQETTTTAPAKTLTIGEIEPLTGTFGDIFKYVPQGAELAKDYINNKGGITIDGQQYLIDLEVRDGKDSPDGATAAATELVLDKDLKFIAGTGPAFMVPAIDAVTEPAGVLYTAVYQNGQKVEMGPKYPLKFVGSNCSFSGQVAALTYLKDTYPSVKTIAFILIDDGQIADNDPVVRATAAKLGLSIKGDTIGYAPTTQDFTPIAQKAVALDADAIMIGNAITPWFGLSLKAIRALGYTKPVFSCCDAIVLPDIVGIAGADAEGFFGPSIPADAAIPDLPQIAKDVMSMASDKGWVLNEMHVQGFSAVYSLVQAIQAANSLDPQTVAAKWETMDKIDTIFGEGKMGGLQTYGVNHNVYFKTPISVIKDGKVEFGSWISLDQSLMP